eukprot:305024_1
MALKPSIHNIANQLHRFANHTALPTMKYCLVFPGMGSEHTGMGITLANEFKYINSFLKDCDELLGIQLSNIMFNADIKTISKPIYAGNALFIYSLCLWKVLQNEYGIDSILNSENTSVIGHSMGEYTALNVINAYKNWTDSVSMNNLIAQMADTYSSDEQGMFAIKSRNEIDINNVEFVIEKHNVNISNINAANQIIISGLKKDINSVINELNINNKASYLLGRYLPTKGAFHSYLMKESEIIINEKWDSFVLNKQFKYDIYLNIIGGKYKPEMGLISDVMKPQLYSTMNWYKCITNYIDSFNNNQNVNINFVEIGANNVLSRLISDICTQGQYDKLHNINVISINTAETIQQIQPILKNYSYKL